MPTPPTSMIALSGVSDFTVPLNVAIIEALPIVFSLQPTLF